jgi:hypothetical protein
MEAAFSPCHRRLRSLRLDGSFRDQRFLEPKPYEKVLAVWRATQHGGVEKRN